MTSCACMAKCRCVLSHIITVEIAVHNSIHLDLFFLQTVFFSNGSLPPPVFSFRKLRFMYHLKQALFSHLKLMQCWE